MNLWQAISNTMQPYGDVVQLCQHVTRWHFVTDGLPYELDQWAITNSAPVVITVVACVSHWYIALLINLWTRTRYVMPVNYQHVLASYM